MRKFFARIFLAAAALCAAAATASAQPEHNDTLRTSTWSIYVQGGVGGFYGMRGPADQYSRDTRYLAPTMDFGFMFFPRPWLRLGLDFGYTYLKSSDYGVLTESASYPGVTKEGYTGTLTVDKARIQNKNFTQTASTDFTLGINFVEIWRERESQWFNIWLSVGAGYMHGWNCYTYSWAIDQNLVSDTPEHTVYWTHSSVESDETDNQFNTLYIPGMLSMEFDVIPQLTLGLYGRYKYFPLTNIYHTPTAMWDAGLVLRYNIVGRKQGFQNKNDKIDALRSDVAFYNAQLAESEKRNESLSTEVDSLKKAMAAAAAVAPVVAPVPEVEVEEPQGNFGVQIYAFKRYQHAPDESMFYGYNPVIYRNGRLRKYVVFTQSLSEAKKQLEPLKARFPDAFIVTIDPDGTVKSYE